MANGISVRCQEYRQQRHRKRQGAQQFCGVKPAKRLLHECHNQNFPKTASGDTQETHNGAFRQVLSGPGGDHRLKVLITASQ